MPTWNPLFAGNKWQPALYDFQWLKGVGHCLSTASGKTVAITSLFSGSNDLPTWYPPSVGDKWRPLYAFQWLTGFNHCFSTASGKTVATTKISSGSNDMPSRIPLLVGIWRQPFEFHSSGKSVAGAASGDLWQNEWTTCGPLEMFY